MTDPTNQWFPSEGDPDDITLGELAENLGYYAGKTWRLALAVTVVCLVAAVLINALLPPRYRCKATFTVSTGSEGGFDYSVSAAHQLAVTFPYLLESDFFHASLEHALGTELEQSSLSAQTMDNSNLVTIQAVAPSAKQARAMLETAVELYPRTARLVLGSIELHLLNQITTPTRPFNRLSLAQSLAVGTAAGLVLFLTGVMVMALRRRTVRTAEDMQQLCGVELLGVWPRVSGDPDDFSAPVSAESSPAFRESVRAVQARLLAAMQPSGAKTLLVTSSISGEGRSSAALGLAEQLAQGGYRVLLADFDLRGQNREQPDNGPEERAQPDLPGRPQESGQIRRLEPRGLYFWDGHGSGENPDLLLNDPGFYQTMDALRSRVDYLIVDTPPCGQYQDAALLADWADAVLLVVRYGRVTSREVEAALSLLDNRKAPVLGYLLNACPQTGASGYGVYGYGGYGSYGKEAPDWRKAPKRQKAGRTQKA